MNWSKNARVFNLTGTAQWEDPEAFLANQGSKMLITLTDESMYDRYLPNDTVQIQISQNLPENSDGLIVVDDTVLFRQIQENPDDTTTLIIAQTWPQESQIISKDNVIILGYATGILRT